jgi:ribosome-associated protein
MKIVINDQVSLDDADLHFDFIHSSGPGGQNVNKVASAVQLRFDLASSCLPEGVRLRLARLAARRINAAGELVITARRHRTQDANRQEAVQRLVELLQRAAVAPKTRRKTRPTLASQQKRLEAKRRRSAIKRLRGSREPE